MGNPYEQKVQMHKRRRALLEDLVRLSNEYVEYELPSWRNDLLKPKAVMRPPRRAEVRKIMAGIVDELNQDVNNMNLAELSLFAAQVDTIASDKTAKMSSLGKFFRRSSQEAYAVKNKRLENIDAFYVVDSKAKGKPISALPTMEAVIDYITRNSGSKIELMKDLQFNRYMVIAGKRVAIHHEILDVNLEVTLDI